MKAKNFPARKLARQIAANEGGSCRHVDAARLELARDMRTKKDRSSRGRLGS